MSNIGIVGSAYKLPKTFVSISELKKRGLEYNLRRPEELEIPKLQSVDLSDIGGVHSFADEEYGELAMECINELIKKENITGKDIGLIIDFSTVSRATNGISLVYYVQQELKADNAMLLSIGNGSCFSFIMALKIVQSLMDTTPEINYAVLFSEDRVNGKRIIPSFHILGDGSTAMLIKRDHCDMLIKETQSFSIGRFNKIMGINHWQNENFDMPEFENKVIPVHYKVMYDLVHKILDNNNLTIKDIDLFLYQNMSSNDYYGLIGALNLPRERVFMDGLKEHGHVFGGDLLINLTLANPVIQEKEMRNILFINSGAGFSWGAALIQR